MLQSTKPNYVTHTLKRGHKIYLTYFLCCLQFYLIVNAENQYYMKDVKINGTYQSSQRHISCLTNECRVETQNLLQRKIIAQVITVSLSYTYLKNVFISTNYLLIIILLVYPHATANEALTDSNRKIQQNSLKRQEFVST